jgi:ATP-dependent Lhr-like helicase
MGPEAEQHFGRRHFMELLSAFTVDPEMTVLTGRSEIGSVSPLTLSTKIPKGERRILTLAGRNWAVTDVDWRHRRIQVVEHHGAGRSRWSGGAPDISYALAQATREVLLGAEPPVELSRRGAAALEAVRAERSIHVDDSGLVVQPARDGSEWWTFAGSQANNSLVAGLTTLGLTAQAGHECVTFEGGLDALRALRSALEDANPAMTVDQAALDGLKFSAALPVALAGDIIGARASDNSAAKATCSGQLIVASGD